MIFTDVTTYQTTVTQARAHRALKTHVSYFLREHELTMMQWSIIGLVYQAGDSGVRVSDLAKLLDTSLAFITTTVNVLQAKEMLERSTHEQDNRAKIVRLTKLFRPRVSVIEQELHQKLFDWLQSVTGQRDLATYFKVLGNLAKADSKAV